jgi:DNA-binding GntR family transcriptional regulator
MTGALYSVSMTEPGSELYQQIAGELRDGIRSGKYAPGDRLPSLAKLKKQYDCWDGPVNQAMTILRNEGLVRSEQGRGSFALEPPPPEPSQFDVLMGRVDEISEEVRLLKERMTALEQGKP